MPAPLTDLIGRETEVAELRFLLAERRLVTLTGVGGCGKTRLAIAVANELEQRYADGVRFVDLVSVRRRVSYRPRSRQRWACTRTRPAKPSRGT